MKKMSLCSALAAILSGELKGGNEIADTCENVWTKIDLMIRLKFPFKKDYREHLSSDITFYREENDPHYAREDSYTSKIDRQAVVAPID